MDRSSLPAFPGGAPVAAGAGASRTGGAAPSMALISLVATSSCMSRGSVERESSILLMMTGSGRLPPSAGSAVGSAFTAAGTAAGSASWQSSGPSLANASYSSSTNPSSLTPDDDLLKLPPPVHRLPASDDGATSGRIWSDPDRSMSMSAPASQSGRTVADAASSGTAPPGETTRELGAASGMTASGTAFGPAAVFFRLLPAPPSSALSATVTFFTMPVSSSMSLAMESRRYLIWLISDLSSRTSPGGPAIPAVGIPAGGTAPGAPGTAGTRRTRTGAPCPTFLLISPRRSLLPLMKRSCRNLQ
mmetsp:Transcript_28310/g.67450  ORF Transcript_28310/g.67450 Transcript_28310/m.67450 type:complete len:304 (-) Transcript_28310:601-1512(-)